MTSENNIENTVYNDNLVIDLIRATTCRDCQHLLRKAAIEIATLRAKNNTKTQTNQHTQTPTPGTS